MKLGNLWDIQVLVYVLLTAAVVLLMLILLAVINRRVRVMASELESVRRDLRILEEGVATVTASLQSRGRGSQPEVKTAEKQKPPA